MLRRPRAFGRGTGVRALAAVVIAVLVVRRFTPRPEFFPLVTRVDGPPPADAAGVVVFLHGKGGGLKTGERMVSALREAGLPANVSLVLVEGPYHTWFGHQWGDGPAQQASSRHRLRELLRELLG